MSEQVIECRLGDCSEIQTGPFGSQLHASDYEDSGTPIVTVEHLGENRLLHHNLPLVSAEDKTRLARYGLREGDIVFSRVGAIDRRALVRSEENGWLFSGRLLRVRPNPSAVDGQFLSQLLGHPRAIRWIFNHAVGSTMACLNTAILSGVPVRLPELREQQRIAEILSTVDEAIEQTEALIAKTQQIKAGLMHDLFTRGITPDGQLRPPRDEAPHLYQESPLGWIPKEWDVVRVNECGTVKLGRQRSPDQHSGQWTMPYLRVANVYDGFIDYSDVLGMDFTPEERKTFSLQVGDILLNEGQSLELVGRCALFEGEPGAFCFQNTLIRIRAFNDHRPAFFRWLFKLYLDRGRFMTIAKQTTSVAHLGADRLARMSCPKVPTHEQERIGDRLGSLQSSIDQQTAQRQKLEVLKSGLMHDLLTGHVRVPVSAERTKAGR